MSAIFRFFSNSQEPPAGTLQDPTKVAEKINFGQIKEKVVTWLKNDMNKKRAVKLTLVAALIATLFLALVKSNLIIAFLSGLSLASTAWLFISYDPDTGFVLLSKE